MSGRPSSVVVIGAGIVGLATAAELAGRGLQVTVLDKEDHVAAHQTGHNSGVVHSGLYYAPGSLKARLGVAGAASMLAFAQRHGIAVEQCGKLVVATRPAQVAALHELLHRGTANGVPCHLVGPDEARTYEPHVRCVAGLRVETTGIVDYVGVTATLGRLLEGAGGELRLRAAVTGVRSRRDGVVVAAGRDEVCADALVNCAGLQADRVARLAGLAPDVRIVPFRGEYVEISRAYSDLVRDLVYPVPDPSLPFLGVHLTRMIGGGTHAGPNAVLALAREGYRWRDVVAGDVLDAATWPGLWRLARRYWRTGVEEVTRSASRARFAASLRELVPEIPDEALVPSEAGVRAQALRRDGRLVDDFLLVDAPHQLHVLNAPSPAATASLEIARHIADRLLSRAA